jgi:hypothetical protein
LAATILASGFATYFPHPHRGFEFAAKITGLSYEVIKRWVKSPVEQGSIALLVDDYRGLLILPIMYIYIYI